MDINELIKKVRRIEIKSRKVVNSLFMGEYHSAFKGQGIEFSEVRDYQYGDDIRLIDWNVSSRMDAPYIKVHQEERELTMMLMVDVSASMYFATRGMLKKDLATEIAAVFAFSAIGNNDKVGSILFGNSIKRFTPPDKGRKHVLMILRDILNAVEEPGVTDMKNALIMARSVLRRKSIIVILSDFLSKDIQDPLKHLSRRHQVVPIWIRDPYDDAPYTLSVSAQHSETKDIQPAAVSSKDIKQIDDVSKKRIEHVRQLFKNCRCRPLDVYTNKLYISELMRYFSL